MYYFSSGNSISINPKEIAYMGFNYNDGTLYILLKNNSEPIRLFRKYFNDGRDDLATIYRDLQELMK